MWGNLRLDGLNEAGAALLLVVNGLGKEMRLARALAGGFTRGQKRMEAAQSLPEW